MSEQSYSRHAVHAVLEDTADLSSVSVGGNDYKVKQMLSLRGHLKSASDLIRELEDRVMSLELIVTIHSDALDMSDAAYEASRKSADHFQGVLLMTKDGIEDIKTAESLEYKELAVDGLVRMFDSISLQGSLSK